MTAKEIADQIDQLKATYAGTSFGLVLLNDPFLPQWMQDRGYDLGSTLALGRQNNTMYEGLDLHKSLAITVGNPQHNLNFLGALIITMISIVGDSLSRENYFDKTPELEFFRHIRNGVSHGNTFNFIGPEPRRPAQFGNFVIDQSLQGKAVLFEFMSTGDVFDLLDHTATHLRALP